MWQTQEPTNFYPVNSLFVRYLLPPNPNWQKVDLQTDEFVEQLRRVVGSLSPTKCSVEGFPLFKTLDDVALGAVSGEIVGRGCLLHCARQAALEGHLLSEELVSLEQEQHKSFTVQFGPCPN